MLQQLPSSCCLSVWGSLSFPCGGCEVEAPAGCECPWGAIPAIRILRRQEFTKYLTMHIVRVKRLIVESDPVVCSVPFHYGSHYQSPLEDYPLRRPEKCDLIPCVLPPELDSP